MKLCINCRFAIQLVDEQLGTRWQCMRDSDRRTSPVDGREIYVDCELARVIGEPCGRNGKHFEPKAGA